jgi:hypothetical protein
MEIFRCTGCTICLWFLVQGLVASVQKWWAWVVYMTNFSTSWYLRLYMNNGIYARIRKMYRLYRLYRTRVVDYARARADICESAQYKAHGTRFSENNFSHKFIHPSKSVLSSRISADILQNEFTKAPLPGTLNSFHPP